MLRPNTLIGPHALTNDYSFSLSLTREDIARFARSSKYCSVHRTEPGRIKLSVDGKKERTGKQIHKRRRERGKYRNVTGAVHIKT